MKKLEYRIGSSYDVHRFKEGNQIIIGGVKIPCKYSLIAHSDGDVCFHALAESILGSMGLGDLGKFFKVDDHSIDNISSSIILKKCYQMALDLGYEVNNIDISIILESIKLKDYIPLMKKNISSLLNVPEEVICIKAMTNEELDDLGKSKGVSSFCTILMRLI